MFSPVPFGRTSEEDLMPIRDASRPVPLPKNWPNFLRSGVLHAISLASTAMTHAWSRAASRSSPQRQRGEIDRLRAEITHLKEEMEIKDSRWGRHSPRRRPHYGPVQRMRILQLRAARGWTVAQVAERFLVTEDTIVNWMRRLEECGEAALVRLEEPVNKFPAFVTYLVRHLKVLSPTLGKKRIANMLARAGLHLSASTVRRMLKRDLSRDDVATEMPVVETTGRRVKTRRANHIWHVDLTVIPTGGGFWTPWFPFTKIQRWPFCWWAAVAVDHASRQLVGFALFKTRPTSARVSAFLGRAIKKAGSKPKYIITDQGKEFCGPFKSWCGSRGIRPRVGAVGKHGSICVVERFIRSMKTECTRRILVSFRLDQMRCELAFYASWYNEHRPHMGLGRRTPEEVYHSLPAAADAPRFEPRARWPRGVGKRKGRAGVRLQLILSHVGNRRHLPVVELKRAA